MKSGASVGRRAALVSGALHLLSSTERLPQSANRWQACHVTGFTLMSFLLVIRRIWNTSDQPADASFMQKRCQTNWSASPLVCIKPRRVSRQC